MSLLAKSGALHRRARAFIAAYETALAQTAPGARVKYDAPESFDALACDIARFQARTIPGFARLLQARRVDPDALTRAVDVPGVPTEAFKATRISAFSEHETKVIFRTSGTTIGARGEHAIRTLENDDYASLVLGGQALGFSSSDTPTAIFALTLSPEDAPDSSLIHMFDTIIARYGAKTARTYFLEKGEIEKGALKVAAFVDALTVAHAAGQRAIVLGTSFAFVHLLDMLGGRPLAHLGVDLALHTGGTKGRSRDVSRDELEADIARAFGLSSEGCIAEYGMTELSSEFYRSARAGSSTLYFEPPWARVVAVDPVTLTPVGQGEIGIAKVIDLLNVDSAVAVLTQDRVRHEGQGFDILGRFPGAPPRGCSLSVEEMLG